MSSFRRIAIERGGKDADSTDVVLSSPEICPEMNMQADPALRRGRRHAVLYVGVMGSQDGVDLLLDAAFELVHTCGRNDVQFLLAGDGPERPALVRRAAELGLTEHVTFLGFVTGPRLWQAFRSSDLGVCPDPKNSFNDHLTMNKLLEYMAFGLPVVAFNLTVSMQLVGDAGRFVLTIIPPRWRRKSYGCSMTQRRARSWAHAGNTVFRVAYHGSVRRKRSLPPTTALERSAGVAESPSSLYLQRYPIGGLESRPLTDNRPQYESRNLLSPARGGSHARSDPPRHDSRRADRMPTRDHPVIIADLLRDCQSSLVDEGVDAYHSRASPVVGRFCSATKRLDTRQRFRTTTWVVLPA